MDIIRSLGPLECILIALAVLVVAVLVVGLASGIKYLLRRRD